MSKDEIINTLNHAAQLLPQENEITDNLYEVISQLEDEWEGDFEEDF